MSLSECSVSAFLELLGSAAAAPGGGSASALAGALGASLSEMVGALTVTRKQYEQYREETEICLEKCAALRAAFLDAVDHDTEVFSSFSAALKLPSQTPEEKEIRASAIQDALILCIESPLHVMELAYEAATVLQNMPGRTNISAESDLGVASLMLGVAVQSALLNILINLRSLKDKEKGAAYLEKGTDLLNRTLNITRTIYDQLLAAHMAQQTQTPLKDALNDEKKNHMKLSVIFEDKPGRWGFRGDPYFWDYLKKRAENMDLLSPDELENWIKAEYLSLSGKVLTDRYMDFAVIKQFAHGGMSSGGVDNRWWMDEGIPLLKSRLAAL